MANEDAVPEEIVDFFRKVRELADDAVRRLEQAAAEPAGQAIQLVPHDAYSTTTADTVSITVHPATVRAKAIIGTPTVTITREEVEAAKTWLGSVRAKIATVGVAAGIAVWKGAEVLDTLEGLISLAERLLGIGH